MASKKVIYSRGFPYGAPLVLLRGGGTRDQAVKDFLKQSEGGWHWDGQYHAYKSYMYGEQLTQVLVGLRDLGYDIVPKDNMDPAYVLDLDPTGDE